VRRRRHRAAPRPPGLHVGDRRAQVCCSPWSLSAPSRRLYDRAAEQESRRAPKPRNERSCRLPRTREEAWEARMVVLAGGRSSGSGASSAKRPGSERSPILAGTGSAQSTARGPACDPGRPRVVCSSCRCDSGTRIVGSAVRLTCRRGNKRL
jgi:hypothetical protein